MSVHGAIPCLKFASRPITLARAVLRAVCTAGASVTALVLKNLDKLLSSSVVVATVAAQADFEHLLEYCRLLDRESSNDGWEHECVNMG
jgi:hypothetical protein